jgi:transposase
MSQPITRTGIDLAKNVFQVCATDTAGKVLFNRQVSRKQLPSLVVNTPACEAVMEACASVHYWARVFARMGHSIKLIHPAYVKPE